MANARPEQAALSHRAPKRRRAPRFVRLRAALSLIHDRETRGTYPPTVREIGLAMGLRSLEGAYYWMRTLERLGYVHRGGARIARSVHTTAAGRAFLLQRWHEEVP